MQQQRCFSSRRHCLTSQSLVGSHSPKRRPSNPRSRHVMLDIVKLLSCDISLCTHLGWVSIDLRSTLRVGVQKGPAICQGVAAVAGHHEPGPHRCQWRVAHCRSLTQKGGGWITMLVEACLAGKRLVISARSGPAVLRDDPGADTPDA